MTTTFTAGKYLTEVRDQGFELSLGKESPHFYLRLLILGRFDSAGKVQECPRYERFYIQYINNETGVKILRGDLLSLGLEFTDLTQLAPGAPNHLSLNGKKIEVVCALEVYKGQERERWYIHRQKKKLDLSDLKALDEKFGRRKGEPPRPEPGTPGPENANPS
jgi:hypothetical protein